MKLILATHNKDKVRELRELTSSLGVEVLSKADVGLADLDPVEDGDSLRANAEIKVRAIAEALDANGYDRSDAVVLADDTGLFVDALNGAPGIHSARFAGEQCSYDDNVDKLLRELAEVPDDRRGAHFQTVIAVLSADGLRFVEGRLEGHIVRERRGTHGFGYDPVFFANEAGRTLAELGADEKNKISHRGRAYQALLRLWREKQ